MAIRDKDQGLKILSFNWHEAYLCLLSETGHNFFVFEPYISDNNQRKWNFSFRPMPQNVKTISQDEMQSSLEKSFFDLIICNNVKDLLTVLAWPKTPKILVFHNKLTTEIALGGNTVDRQQYLEKIKPLLEGVELVFISESKRQDWGMDGEIIPPGVDINSYGGYRGDLRAVLTVGNRIVERDLMMGFREQVELTSGLPIALVGDNPQLPESRISDSWDDLKNHYRSCRVYLNTTKHPHEDGYNLSLLEAMATGMPVVSLASPTSPITDGKEGFVSDDMQKLRKALELLLNDPLLAKTMGEQSRKTVAEKFPMDKFIYRWNSVITKAVGVRVEGGYSKAKLNIWMDYAYYPATTAHYLRRAFDNKHNLVTSGPSIPPEVIKIWNLENMKAPILNQDIPRSAAGDAEVIRKTLPSDFKPDFFFWVETGLDLPPRGIEMLNIPKAAYFIDSHLNLESHINLARAFDFIFLAQKEYIPPFHARGIANVHWLPLGCDPEIHGKRDIAKTCDIGFAGSITASHQRRKSLLERLQRKFNVRVERVFLEEMTELYSASKIVFNNAIRRDLNMRVFEALCSGSMLLTDSSVGQDEFFEDRKHLVVYNDGNIEELAAYYLTHDDERESIARAGREKALAEHTYAHRAAQIARTVMAGRAAIDIRNEEPAAYYRSVRTDMTALVPETAVRILEVGCAAGETARALKKENPSREIVGIEYNEKASAKAAAILDAVYCGDCERLDLPYPPGYFDCILYGDVLEHLYDPEKLLKRHRRLLAPDGVMVMSIPNIQNASLLNQLMEGRFTYQSEGLLDRTHLRFFTQMEIEDMLKRAGLVPVTMQGKLADTVSSGPLAGTLRVGRWQLDNLTADEMVRFFVIQYLITAKKADPREEINPWEPEVFRELAAASPLFDESADDPLSGAAALLAKPDDADFTKIAVFLDGTSETHPDRLVWLGQLNMAAGRFTQAEEAFHKAGAAKWEGCAFAARGLLNDALFLWRSEINDNDARDWFERFRHSPYSAGALALAAAKEGKGISASRSDEPDFTKSAGNDYFCSDGWLDNQPDVIGSLRRIADTLRPGGMFVARCGGHLLKEDDAYPVPLHRFSPDGFKNIAKTAGFDEIAVTDIYSGAFFAAVCHKPGGGKPDYDARLKRLCAEYPATLALRYWDRKLYEASAQAARATLMFDPENRQALCKLGDSLMRMGKTAEAEAYYEKAAAHGSGEAPFIGLGTVYLGRNEFDRAAGHFEKALAANPQNDRALTGMGMSLAGAGRLDEGKKYYCRALSVNPENGMALSALVQACYQTGDFETAEREIANYLELHPANIDMLFGLAGVQYRSGKNAEALEAVEKILLFKPDHSDALMLMEKIASGGSRQ